MLLLAFDTATPASTVAVHDGDRVLAQRTVIDPMRHGEVLAPGIAEVLREAGRRMPEVTEVVVGVGPGPFTGLRVGLVTARTLGSVLGVPVHGVCTLDILAAGAEPYPDPSSATSFLVATDARRREVYWARYADRHHRVDGPGVTRPADLATADPVVGQGGLIYPEEFPHAAGPAYPSAGVLSDVAVAGAVPTLAPEPLYLRRPDAAEPGTRKPVLAR